MSYCDIFNFDLIYRIPSASRLILHVGCGAGVLGEEYKRRNPKATIIGIEDDEDAVQLAKTRLDSVYFADLDENPTPFGADIAKSAVDCIVYGPAFTQTLAPWQILESHMEFLTEDGSIIMCVPNMDHWSIVEGRLKGALADANEGFAERGQANFLVEDQIRGALSRIGLFVVDSIPYGSDFELTDIFLDRVAPMLTEMGIDLVAYARRIAPTHHIWRARRQPVTAPLAVVSTMLTPVGGVSEVRVVEPMQALRADPSLLAIVVSNGDPPSLRVEDRKIFILHRPLLAGNQGLGRVRELIREGWLVVCEFDDHPDYIPVLQRPDIQNFRAVHAVQTTTSALASVLSRHNPEVGIFRNAIAVLPTVRNFIDPDCVTLFFAGLNRDKDWPPYMSVLNAIAKRFGKRIRFEVVNDRVFFDSLQTEQKNFTPLCDYRVYQNILSMSEISFMPLLRTPFNACKSDLKYIEAAAHRVVALAGSVVYSDVIEDGRTGLLFDTPDDLERHLVRLVDDHEWGRTVADAARNYVIETRMLEYQLSQRASWYRSLWERRDLLRESLSRRVPEI